VKRKKKKRERNEFPEMKGDTEQIEMLNFQGNDFISYPAIHYFSSCFYIHLV